MTTPQPSAVHVYDLNNFGTDQPKLVPLGLYTLPAAAACNSFGGKTTSFAAKFVDPTATQAETWDFIHASSATPNDVANAIETIMEHRISEYAAVALIVAVLFKRHSMKVREVIKVGKSSDYVMEDFQGKDAGTVEISGTKKKHASNVTNTKRKQAKKTVASVRRIGIAAYGGPQIHIEVLP